VKRKHATVEEMLNTNTVNISFRRALVGVKLIEWYNLDMRIAHIDLIEGMDIFVWNLADDGRCPWGSIWLPCSVRPFTAGGYLSWPVQADVSPKATATLGHGGRRATPKMCCVRVLVGDVLGHGSS
jgi:hypothetical protein